MEAVKNINIAVEDKLNREYDKVVKTIFKRKTVVRIATVFDIIWDK